MRSEPDDVSAVEVLDAVRQRWETPVDVAAYLPVGFGAHHRCLTQSGPPVLFATLDVLEPRRTLVEPEGADGAAAPTGRACPASHLPRSDHRHRPLRDVRD